MKKLKDIIKDKREKKRREKEMMNVTINQDGFIEIIKIKKNKKLNILKFFDHKLKNKK